MRVAITTIGSFRVASDINVMTTDGIAARRKGLDEKLGALIAVAEKLRQKAGGSAASELERHIQSLKDLKERNVPGCSTQWEFQRLENVHISPLERLLNQRAETLLNNGTGAWKTGAALLVELAFA